MVDENYGDIALVALGPEFGEGKTVAPMSLLRFIDWVRASNCVLKEKREPEGMLVISMPPVQRAAVWRPKQVLDLWDSLMRGLPIGTFYLVDYHVERPPNVQKVVPVGGGGTTQSAHAGFDLLDGQQRVRALLIGTHGFAEEKRCLWIDLGTNSSGEKIPSLRLTSKAQPFGYDFQTGNRLDDDKRRKARQNIEPMEPQDRPDQHIRVRGDDGTLRNAYDQELFDGKIAPEGIQIIQPPFPYGATPGKTFMLHKLLAAWRRRSPSDPAGGIEALRRATENEDVAGGGGTATIDPASLRVLHEAFRKVEEAQVALLRVDPLKFGQQDLLALYDRIGAGGTPLTNEERLYSIYKHHIPEIRDAVDDICNVVGHVLPPTKIAATALRIANALSNDRNNTPDVVTFSKEMAEPEGKLRKELERLIPAAWDRGNSHSAGPLCRAFEKVKTLLSWAGDAGEYWMPDVLLVALPAELWQVLIFWAVRCPDFADLGSSSRQEVVRFALFWHICVGYNDKAANWAFEDLKRRNIIGKQCLPAAEL